MSVKPKSASVSVRGVSSRIVSVASAPEGASLTGSTVRVKEVVEEAEPSLTVRVIVAEPKALARGVTVTVRLAPLPPSTMEATGASAVLVLLAETVRAPGAVSTSPTVKASGPVAPSSAMVWLATGVIVGTSLTVVTSKRSVLGVGSVSAPPLATPPSSNTRKSKLA